MFSAWYVRIMLSLFLANEHARGTQVCYSYVRGTMTLSLSTRRVLALQALGVRVFGERDVGYMKNSVLWK